MKTKIATVIAMAMLSAPVMAQQNLKSLDSQVFANQNIKAVELSQTEIKETQGELAPLIAWSLGGAAINMWIDHAMSYTKTGKPASISSVVTSGAIGAIPGGAVRVGATRWGIPKIGQQIGLSGEIKVGQNIRIAPIGNNTGHTIGRLPHYHRRVVDNMGNTKVGQGIGRHRPWETKSTDTSWRNRF